MSRVRKAWVQSQVESYERLKKWYLMPPCLILSTIRWGSRVKWSNPGNRVAPSSTTLCSSYWKGPFGSPSTNTVGFIFIFAFIYIYIYIFVCVWERERETDRQWCVCKCLRRYTFISYNHTIYMFTCVWVNGYRSVIFWGSLLPWDWETFSLLRPI